MDMSVHHGDGAVVRLIHGTPLFGACSGDRCSHAGAERVPGMGSWANIRSCGGALHYIGDRQSRPRNCAPGPHALRHRCASRLMQGVVDLYTV